MQPLRGITLKLLSICVFVAMASLIKATADQVPPGQAVFFRSFFAIPVIVGWLVLRGDLRRGFGTQNPMGHVWRGLVGTTAMGLGFAALGLLPLPEATAIGYAAPLLVVVFAAMFLGEQVGAFRLSTVALGMVGVLIVLAPRLSVGHDPMSARETLGAVVALMGAVFTALAQVFVRKLVLTEDTATIVFWFSVTASVLSLVTLPWGWVMPFLGGDGDAGLCGASGRGGAGAADVELPPRGCQRDRAIRVFLDAPGAGRGLLCLRRGADTDHPGRSRDHHRGGRADHLARAPARARAAGAAGGGHAWGVRGPGT
jgi:drug/metabolite transporter (DMT)-like permease